MKRTVGKIFVVFTLFTGLVTTVLLIINIAGIMYIGGDPQSRKSSLNEMFYDIVNAAKDKTEPTTVPDGWWAILINENGDTVWGYRQPPDIPNKYTINDVARMTKWFLNDYPVYVHTDEQGLFVLGRPKNDVGKFDIELSMDWFSTLGERFLTVLSANILLAAAVTCFLGILLYRRLKLVIGGIEQLRFEKNVHLAEKGIFREVCRNINLTADAIERKNAALSKREEARAGWIAGVSHDIRTPLAVVTGNAESLIASEAIDDADRRKSQAILNSGLRIGRLIDDLSLISSIEYDMQPSRKMKVKVCPLIREAAAAVANSCLCDNFVFELELLDESAEVSGDASLLERAVYNLINNSVRHNPGGCNMRIKEETCGGRVRITVADDGGGISESVIENIDKLPKSAHGLGLPMSYRIAKVHGGRLVISNDNGTKAEMELPQA